MRLGVYLVIGLAVMANLSPAQWLITEVFTGTPDWVEITNVSGGPLAIAGVGIMASNGAACSSGAPTVGGPYFATSAAVVPAGATFVFEDLGVAGSVVLTPGIVGLGEHTGFNYSWAGGSSGEVAIYVGGAVPGGLPGAAPNYFDDIGTLVDYMQIGFFQAVGTTSLQSDFYHLHRGTGPTPSGHWASGPIMRGPAATDGIFRVSVGGIYTDTNSNADWNLSAVGTAGAPNVPGAAGVATAGCELNLVHPTAGVPVLSFNVATGNPPLPGATYYTFISFTPEACAGYSPSNFVPGPIFGMPIDVWGQIFLPVPVPPLNGFLDGAGAALGIVTPMIPPPFAGLPIQARTIVLIGGLPALFSDYVYTTI